MAYTSFMRSVNAKKQLRDRKGRWISMGAKLKYFRNGEWHSGTAEGTKGDYVTVKASDGSSTNIHRTSVEVVAAKATLTPKAQRPQGQGKAAPSSTPEPKATTSQPQAVTTAPQSQDAPSGITDATNWEKVGTQKGSNPGGTYKDDEGETNYVKFMSQDKIKNEVLANRLYDRAGISSPSTEMVKHGDTYALSSPMVPGESKTYAQLGSDEEFRKSIQDGFAVDAWLGNWDVVGLTRDNIVKDENGDPVRIDAGGALLFRAQGAKKGDAFGNSVGELETLRNSSQGKSVFGDMTDEEVRASGQHLADISDSDIDDLVDSVDFDDETATELKTKLKARRDDVLTKLGIEKTEAQDAPEDLDPEESPFKILSAEDRGESGDGYHKESGKWGKYGAAGLMISHMDEDGTMSYLMMQNSLTKQNNAGKWQTFGGALDENETAAQGAAREFHEELGITQEQLNSLIMDAEDVFEDNGWQYTTISATSTEKFGTDKLDSEANAAKWVTEEELLEMRDKGELIPGLTENLDNLLGIADEGEIDEPTIDVEAPDDSTDAPSPKLDTQTLKDAPLGSTVNVVHSEDKESNFVKKDSDMWGQSDQNEDDPLMGASSEVVAWVANKSQSHTFTPKEEEEEAPEQGPEKPQTLLEKLMAIKPDPAPEPEKPEELVVSNNKGETFKAGEEVHVLKEDGNYHTQGYIEELYKTVDGSVAAKVKDNKGNVKNINPNKLEKGYNKPATREQESRLEPVKFETATGATKEYVKNDDGTWSVSVNGQTGFGKYDEQETKTAIENDSAPGSGWTKVEETSGLADWEKELLGQFDPEPKAPKYTESMKFVSPSGTTKVFIKNDDGTWGIGMNGMEPDGNYGDSAMQDVIDNHVNADWTPVEGWSPEESDIDPDSIQSQLDAFSNGTYVDLLDYPYVKNSDGNWVDPINGEFLEDEVIDLLKEDYDNDVIVEEANFKMVQSIEKFADLYSKAGGDNHIYDPETNSSYYYDPDSDSWENDQGLTWDSSHSLYADKGPEITDNGSYIQTQKEADALEAAEMEAAEAPPQVVEEGPSLTSKNGQQLFAGSSVHHPVKDVYGTIQSIDEASKDAHLVLPDGSSAKYKAKFLNKIENEKLDEVAPTLETSGLKTDEYGETYVTDVNGLNVYEGDDVTSVSPTGATTFSGKVSKFSTDGKSVQVVDENGVKKWRTVSKIQKNPATVQNIHGEEQEQKVEDYADYPVGSTATKSGVTFEKTADGGWVLQGTDPTSPDAVKLPGKTFQPEYDWVVEKSTAPPTPKTPEANSTSSLAPGETTDYSALPNGTQVEMTNVTSGHKFKYVKNESGMWAAYNDGQYNQVGGTSSSDFKSLTQSYQKEITTPDGTEAPKPGVPLTQQELEDLPVGAVVSDHDGMFKMQKMDTDSFEQFDVDGNLSGGDWESSYDLATTDEWKVESLPSETEAVAPAGPQIGDKIEYNPEALKTLPIGSQITSANGKNTFHKMADGNWVHNDDLDNPNPYSSDELKHVKWTVTSLGGDDSSTESVDPDKVYKTSEELEALPNGTEIYAEWMTDPNGSSFYRKEASGWVRHGKSGYVSGIFRSSDYMAGISDGWKVKNSVPAPSNNDFKVGDQIVDDIEEGLKSLPVGTVISHNNWKSKKYKKVGEDAWGFLYTDGTTGNSFPSGEFTNNGWTIDSMEGASAPSAPKSIQAKDQFDELPVGAVVETPGGTKFKKVSDELWKQQFDNGDLGGSDWDSGELSEDDEVYSVDVSEVPASTPAVSVEKIHALSQLNDYPIGTVISDKFGTKYKKVSDYTWNHTEQDYNLSSYEMKGKAFKLEEAVPVATVIKGKNGGVLEPGTYVKHSYVSGAEGKILSIDVNEDDPSKSKVWIEVDGKKKAYQASSLNKSKQTVALPTNPDSPWFQKEAPTPPTYQEASSSLNLPDGFEAEVKTMYEASKGKSLESSAVYTKIKSIIDGEQLEWPSGTVKPSGEQADDAYDYLFVRGWISAEMRDLAKKSLVENQANLDKVNTANKVLKDQFTADFNEWKSANGVGSSFDASSYIDTGGDFSGARTFKSDNEGMKYGQTVMGEGEKNMFTSAVHNSIYSYTSSGYKTVNTPLRVNKVEPTDQLTTSASVSAKTMQKHMDEAFEQIEGIPEELITYRGTTFGTMASDAMGGAYMESVQDAKQAIGSIVTDFAYMSTSIGATPAFNKDVYLKIRLPEGFKGLWVGGGKGFEGAHQIEREVLLPRGTRFLVHDVQENVFQPGWSSSKTVMTLEAVPEGWTPEIGKANAKKYAGISSGPVNEPSEIDAPDIAPTPEV